MNQLPPHKEEIEIKMILMLVFYPDLLKTLYLKDEHFYNKNNLLAFRALREMSSRDENITLATFGSRFSDANGDISKIIDLTNEPLLVSDADVMLKILVEESAKRKIWEEYQINQSPKDFIERIKKIENDFIENKPQTLTEAYEQYKINYKLRKQKLEEKGAIGLVTGFKKIDSNCTFENGNLIILAAKTSIGKTALAVNIAINASMCEQKVLFFSAEMATNEIMNRILAQFSSVSSTKFKYCNAGTSFQYTDESVKVCGQNLKFIEASSMSSEEICRIARQDSLMGKPDLIVIDYLQYLKDRIERGQTNNDRIGGITRNLKALAMEIECPVLLLSQVNRAATGAPDLMNLRDSGNIEQDADIVLIIHREDREDVTASLIIAKNRNGSIGKIDLKFKPELTKFYE